MRTVSVLEVSDPAVLEELAVLVDLDACTERVLSPTERIMRPDFDRGVLPELQSRGVRVLVRYARRSVEAARAVTEELAEQIAALPLDVRRVLYSAQRHSLDDVVLGEQAWDPAHDVPFVRALVGAGLLHPMGEEHAGRYHLNPDLPPPPRVALDLEEAVMDETDDLSEALPGPVSLLHDLASLAAALEHHPPSRTHAGTLARADVRHLRTRLQTPDLDGHLEAHPRWGRALRALEALGAVSMDPISRELHLDHGLEDAIAGEAGEAVDRLVHKVVDRDLHAALPAVREALRQAGAGAVDEVVWLELLHDQDREVLLTPWTRGGVPIYPAIGDEPLRRFDLDGWEAVEVRMLGALLKRLERLGLIRRAPGVFAATADGRRWAGVALHPPPPVWVSSDLEVLVPPDAVTPWERFQIERLGRCVARDVVDRYRLEREGLVRWLATHDLSDALALLERRCPALPSSVVETLSAWGGSALRVVLTRGVLLGDEGAAAYQPAKPA